MNAEAWFAVGWFVGLLTSWVWQLMDAIPRKAEQEQAQFDAQAREARERIARGCRQTDGQILPPRGGSSTAPPRPAMADRALLRCDSCDWEVTVGPQVLVVFSGNCLMCQGRMFTVPPPADDVTEGEAD